MKKIVVAFTGPSNSGKTTLITKLSNYLKEQNFKICIVKHDPKDKAVFDTVGKDSYKFSQTGADVAVVSPNKTTLFKQETSSLNEKGTRYPFSHFGHFGNMQLFSLIFTSQNRFNSSYS